MNRNILLLLSLQTFSLCCSESRVALHNTQTALDQNYDDLKLQPDTAYLVFLGKEPDKKVKIQEADKAPYEIVVKKDNVYILSVPCDRKGVKYQTFNNNTHRWNTPSLFSTESPHLRWVKDLFEKSSNEFQEKEKMIREKLEVPLLSQQTEESEREEEGFLSYFRRELGKALDSF